MAVGARSHRCQATPMQPGQAMVALSEETASWMPLRRSISAACASCSIRNLKMDPGMFGAGPFGSSRISNRVSRTARIGVDFGRRDELGRHGSIARTEVRPCDGAVRRTLRSRQSHAKMRAYNYLATADIRLLQSVCFQRALRLALAVTILSLDMFAFNGRASIVPAVTGHACVIEKSLPLRISKRTCGCEHDHPNRSYKVPRDMAESRRRVAPIRSDVMPSDAPAILASLVL